MPEFKAVCCCYCWLHSRVILLLLFSLLNYSAVTHESRVFYLIIFHWSQLFVAAVDLVNRQVVHCHRVLRTVQLVAEKSSAINSRTWDALLRFLLKVNDVLLAPPTEKGLACCSFFVLFYRYYDNDILHVSLRHWVTLTFDLAFRSAIHWAKP